MACSIAWFAFSWEAFATLVTGLAAVLAAWLIGRRQVEIQKQQTEILNRQTEIQASTLRADLFDRRFEIYEKTSAFMGKFVKQYSLTNPELEQFNAAIRKSNFLFSPKCVEGLEEIFSKASELHWLSEQIASDQKQGKVNQNDITKRNAVSKWFNAKLRTYKDLGADIDKVTWIT